ncbi:hypothetical protein ABZ949_32240 [Micromonospora tulbaghiae]|uniref:hypothetical protein n=1 Tax=Micromonospora tulbaghiae TaxID=479978 RepID=UPI0034025596
MRPDIYCSAGTGPLQSACPTSPGTGSGFHSISGDRARLEFVGSKKLWLVSRGHYTKLVDAPIARHGQVDVLAEFTATTKVCDTPLPGGEGFDCTCSCFGDTHGGGQ